MVTVITAYLSYTIKPVAVAACGGLLSFAGNSRLPDMLRAALYSRERSKMWPILALCATTKIGQLLVVPLPSIAACARNRTLLSFQNGSAFCPEQ